MDKIDLLGVILIVLLVIYGASLVLIPVLNSLFIYQKECEEGSFKLAIEPIDTKVMTLTNEGYYSQKVIKKVKDFVLVCGDGRWKLYG
jgi:hypothetical protein